VVGAKQLPDSGLGPGASCSRVATCFVLDSLSSIRAGQVGVIPCVDGSVAALAVVSTFCFFFFFHLVIELGRRR